MSAVRLTGGSAWKKLLSSVETVLLDCDGEAVAVAWVCFATYLSITMI